MANTTCGCELVWINCLLNELDARHNGLMSLHCENQAFMHITKNQFFYEQTKHIEVDCDMIQELVIRTSSCSRILHSFMFGQTFKGILFITSWARNYTTRFFWRISLQPAPLTRLYKVFFNTFKSNIEPIIPKH